jgi:CRISPR-associated protein Cas1
LFGVEGRAAQRYWAAIRLTVPEALGFQGRVRQGAGDPFNVLLNYAYGVLSRRVLLAIVRAGLHPALSFLHAPRPNEPALAFDLIEEFRAPVADRTLLRFVGRGRRIALEGDGRLPADVRRALVACLHARLATLVPYRNRQATLAEIIDAQAASVVDHLKGTKRDRPFLARW